MGLFDNVLKSLDSTLKAIEDGALEKTFVQAVDALDRSVGKAPEPLEKIADMPEKIIHNTEQKTEKLRETGEKLKEQMNRPVDTIKKD